MMCRITRRPPPTRYYPVYDCGSLTTLMPLSYDWTALNSKIDDMSPNGNTDVTIGLVWAWHALTAQAPLSEAAAPAPDLDKVIIVLTDGDNTEAWKNSNNTKVTSQSAIDTAHRACLRQHQGRQHPDLYDPRDQRQRFAAAKLRDQPNHVLRCAAGEPAQRRVRLDRAEPGQPSPRQVTPAANTLLIDHPTALAVFCRHATRCWRRITAMVNQPLRTAQHFSFKIYGYFAQIRKAHGRLKGYWILTPF